MIGGYSVFDSRIESKFSSELALAKVKFEQEKEIGKYFADFYLPEYNLVVELDGRQFHTSPKQLEHDARKNRYLLKKGYKLIRITGSMLWNNVDAIIPILRLFPNSKEVYYINSMDDIIHIQKYALGQFCRENNIPIGFEKDDYADY